MKKILLIGTGGTIACAKKDKICLDSPFKILQHCRYENIEFDCISPFFVLSENMSLELWSRLAESISQVDFEKYAGVIVLHGSDTLSFTAAFLGNLFYFLPIVITASDKPLEDKSANGFKNFDNAVRAIESGIDRVYISYDGLYRAEKNEPLQNPAFMPKNILVINSYVGIEYNNYDLAGVDAVLHTMYHSATAPERVKKFVEKCKSKSIPFYFVTENSSANYESARDFDSIIFNSSLESAYARLLLQ
ncbi:MAG: asparaginase domain-containing protein [Eubacterium sp.]